MTNVAYQSCKRSFQFCFVQLTFVKKYRDELLWTSNIFFFSICKSSLTLIWVTAYLKSINVSLLPEERYALADQNWMQLLFLRQDNIYVSTYLTESNCLHNAYNTNCCRKIFNSVHFGLYSPQKLTVLRCFKTCLITGLAAIGLMYSVWIFHWLG